jgi:putative CocE/NonD family hydrolase
VLTRAAPIVVNPRGARMPVETPFSVKVLHDVMIPMPDGVRLAANLFLPEEPGQYPGILSFTPYLKDGYGGISHQPHHRHFASRGYAVMQVDFRGTGSSEGTNPHPFDVQEREDGYQIVEWMAAQPWCTGNVGIWGISYGGITSLSIASTQPPHLRAIVPIHATVDNYEWLHRTHGCRGLLLGDVDWGTRMVVSNLLPPVRQDTEGRWARLWAERLEANNPWFFDWHGCPPDPDFWSRRRIPYERINVPTFGICGWYDAYTAPTFTVYEAVQAPKRVLIGPWKHALADLSPMSPIGGVHEMDRWWDRWLKGIENSVEHEPPVTIYVMGHNSWRHETEWPIARTEPRRLHLHGQHELSVEPPSAAGTDSYEYDARVGSGSIGYNGHRLNLPIPTDQAADDHLSLAYTGAPLPSDLEITGVPRAHSTQLRQSSAPAIVSAFVSPVPIFPTFGRQLASTRWRSTAAAPAVPGSSSRSCPRGPNRSPRPICNRLATIFTPPTVPAGSIFT